MTRETQQNFDWNRARRQDWLDHLVIPRFDRVEAGGDIRLARTGVMKRLLIAIESFTRDGGEWQLKIETIAQRMGLSVRQTERIVSDCEVRGLLSVRRVEGVSSFYAIRWEGVKEILLENPQTASKVEEPPRKAQRTESVRSGRKSTKESGVGTPDNLTGTPDNFAGTPDNLTGTPDKLTEVNEGDTYLSRARGLQPCLKPCSQPSIQPCFANVDLPEERNYHGWPFEVGLVHLKDANQVQRLWEHALDYGYVKADCRVRFFALAICVAEMPDVRNHGGYFTKRIKQRKWLGSPLHIRRAIEAIRRFDDADTTPMEDRPRVPISSNVAEAQARLKKAWGME